MQARGTTRTRMISALFLLAACLLIPGAPSRAAYPDRVIKIVVPFAPGGGTDVVARTLAQEMARDSARPSSSRTSRGQAPSRYPAGRGQSAGRLHAADGNVRQCRQSQPESKLPYDAHKDFAAVALLARSFNIVVVNPASPHQIDRGPDRSGEGRARQAQLWHLRHRHVGASGRRIVQAHGRGQSDDGALQGRGACDHRPDGRPDRLDLHDRRQRRVAGRGRPVARHRRHLGRTLAGFPAASHRSEAGVPGYAAEAWYGLTRRPRRRPRSSTVSTSRPRRPSSPRPSRSSARTRASSWWRSRRRRSIAILPPRKTRWRKVIEDAGIKAE